MIDDAVALNCPYCGKAMAHLRSRQHWHFYQCEKCGPVTLPPNGPIRRTKPSDHDDDTNGQNAFRDEQYAPSNTLNGQ